jgi:hypothetical protein
LVSSEKYTLNGISVNTERFRVEEQGKKSHEFEKYKGVLINETVWVSSLAELTKIFDGTSVRQFSRREDDSTFDPAEVEAWKAELVHIAVSGKSVRAEHIAHSLPINYAAIPKTA